MSLIRNELANSAEFTIEKKKEGSYGRLRIWLWLAYLGFPIVLGVVLSLVNWMPVWLFVFVPLYGAFLLPRLIYPATYIYAQIEYEYIIMQGKFSVNYIYGKRKRKELMPAETISNFELLAPYKDKYKDFVLSQTFDHKYEAVAYLDHPDNYVCVYTNEKGESCCTIFQCNMKFLKLFKFHFKDTVDSELTIKE